MENKYEDRLNIEDFLPKNNLDAGRKHLEEIVKSGDFYFEQSDILKMREYASWLVDQYKRKGDYSAIAEIAEVLRMEDVAIDAYLRLHKFDKALYLVDKWDLPKEKKIEVCSRAHNYHRIRIKEYQRRINELDSSVDEALNSGAVRSEYERAIQKHLTIASNYASMIKQLKGTH